MQTFDLVDGRFRAAVDPFVAELILPPGSIMLQRTPLTYGMITWSVFIEACHILAKQIASPVWLFIDACWDPFRYTPEQIQNSREELQTIFPNSKICVLSANAQHWYDDIPGCVYFPLFLMINYPDLNFRPRSGRIGCLNRRNAPHRTWLMHHLLEQKLIDPDRDIYSIKFTNLFSDNYWDADHFIKTDWFNEAQKKWPKEIQTHPDNFPCDYSINHPAWHTGVSIITETEPGEHTIICEKTAKGILSKSCFSIYMSDTGYRVLEDLGFEPRFFSEHAEDYNIEPILKICRDITTEAQAIEYRQQHINQIQHNFEWFSFKSGAFQQRPWWHRYEPKLQQALGSL